MENKEKDELKSSNKDGFFIRNIKVYRRYFMYKSSTNKIIGKRLSPRDFKELFKTYATLEEPKKSFKRAMEVEGIVESDLVVAHKRYGYVQVVIMLISIIPLYHFFKVMNHFFKGGEFTLAFLPSVFPPIVSMFFLAFFYLYFSWIQWRIRNKCLATHLKFIRIIFSYPSELSPLSEYDEKMEKKYGEKWENKMLKNKKDV